jgi:hypothetical protein
MINTNNNIPDNVYFVFQKNQPTAPALSDLTGKVENLARRVKLKGFNLDSHFFVDGILVKKNESGPVLAHRYVVINLEGGDKLHLLVASLARRLLLPEAVVREAYSKGQDALEKLIEERSFISKPEFIAFGVYDPEFADCFKDYQSFQKFYNIFKQYEVGHKGHVTLNTEKLPSTLTIDVIKKVMVIAWKKQLTVPAGGELVTVDKQQFIISKEGKDLQIAHYHSYTKVGSGSFGIVHKVLLVTSGIFSAFKMTHPPTTKPAKAASAADQKIIDEEAAKKQLEIDNVLKKEQDILTKLKDKKWAQQVLMVVNLKNGLVAHATRLYEKDLSVWINDPKLTNADRIQCCKQLFKAFKEMWALGIAHLDLKANNIYVDFDGLKPIFRIGDWGSAHLNGSWVKGSIPNTTPEHSNPKIFDQLRKAKTSPEFETAAQKHDLYSAGILFHQILTGKDTSHPYALSKLGWAAENAVFDGKDLASKFDKRLIDMIEKMVALDPAKQPTIEEVTALFDAL